MKPPGELAAEGYLRMTYRSCPHPGRLTQRLHDLGAESGGLQRLPSGSTPPTRIFPLNKAGGNCFITTGWLTR